SRYCAASGRSGFPRHASQHSQLADTLLYERDDRSVAVLETTHLSGNSVEEIVWCEAANGLALRAIFLSRQGLDKRIHDPGKLDRSDSSRHQGGRASGHVRSLSRAPLFCIVLPCDSRENSKSYLPATRRKVCGSTLPAGRTR